MINILSMLFLSSVLFIGCHKKPLNKTADRSATVEKTENKQAASPEVKSAIVDAGTDMAASGAMYNVDSMTINNDTLSIFVNYSGGCKEHTFDLYSNGMYAKSLPPQLSLCLKHTNNGDACRKLIMKELKFNVSNLKYAGKKTVVLKLGENKVTYIN
jgi:hypothetical protein